MRVDWQHGVVFAPPDQMFHQHFNTAPDPARYLAVAFGSLRYPFTADKRHVFMGMDVSVKDGGCQIEYEDQDPRIHKIYLSGAGEERREVGHGRSSSTRRPAASSAAAIAMHDLEFEHLHVGTADEPLNEVAWAADNVELTTVGIDIGSSTSHLMFARVHLQRLGTALSSRFVVVGRKMLWQSPILLTPYLPDYTIDVDELAGFIGGCYAYAGIDRDEIDSGAVILTGEAIKRRNARAIADLFSEEAGKFVCASAGHHMECQPPRNGSGAVALSRGHGVTLLNVDIGGGTTKLALIEKGRIIATTAIAVGGRLVVEDPKDGLTRVEPPATEVARRLGIELALGQPLAAADRKRIAERMARLVMGMIDLRQPGELTRRLLVTEAWPAALANRRIDAMTFSGGVAEYLYKRESRPIRRSRLTISPRRCATRSRTGATCRRSGTRARASAPP